MDGARRHRSPRSLIRSRPLQGMTEPLCNHLASQPMTGHIPVALPKT